MIKARKDMTPAERDEFAAGVMSDLRSNQLSDELTQLNFGGGQDSTTILEKMIYEKDFRARWAPGRLIVVMSDTGAEHPETYRHVGRMMRLSRSNKIEFYFLTSDKLAHEKLGILAEESHDLGVRTGFHTESWSDFVGHYSRVREIPMVSGNMSCTFELKLAPLYRHLEDYVAAEFNLPQNRRKRNGDRGAAKAAPAYAAKNGKIRVLIGIARGEETRIRTAPDKDWKGRTVKICYPLLDEKMDRQGCQDYLAKAEKYNGIPVPPPSNCVFCPFVSHQEILWLARRMPAAIKTWEGLEKAKIEKTAERGNTTRNNGVKGKKTLGQFLADAEAKYGHLTDEELDEYKMSHGHCVGSKY